MLRSVNFTCRETDRERERARQRETACGLVDVSTLETTARVLASQAEAIVRTGKHGHKLLNGGTKHRIDIH